MRPDDGSEDFDTRCHGTGSCDCPECLMDEAYDDEDRDCTHCGGEGYDECHDPIQCTSRHVHGLCPCGACGGSGLAQDQTIW